MTVADKFRQAMAVAVVKAANTDTKQYVVQVGGEFRVQPEWTSRWLFEAYPGGRKALSFLGKTIGGYE